VIAWIRRWLAKDDQPHAHDGMVHAHPHGRRAHRHIPTTRTVWGSS
jgi:hypothetical protein